MLSPHPTPEVDMRRILITTAFLLPLLPLAVSQESQDEATTSKKVEPLDPDLLALFDYDTELDLDVREVGFESFEGYDRIDLSYASPKGGRVPGYLYVPQTDGPWAGMIVMHGMPGDRSSGDSFAPGYARGGALCLAISAPWSRGPRNEWEPISFTEKDRTNQIQLMQDLRRGVDLLLSFDEVDAERMGYVGGSYGGAMGGLLAGIEKRICAFALVVGDGGLFAHMTSPGDEIPPEGLTREEWDKWQAWMEPIEPMRFVAHAAPSALLFQNGRTDQLVPAADAKEYQEAGSEPKTCLWYEDGHSVTGERMRDQAKWFAERIGIDPSPYVRQSFF